MKTTLSTALMVILCLGTTFKVNAQSEIVPSTYAATDGDATFLGPLAGSARTYQVLLNANQLTALTGKQLTGISFRSSTSTTAAWPASNLTYTNYDIYLSESVLPVNRSFTFANNIVGVQKKVRAGVLSIAANSYSAGGPGSFGPSITFDSTYTYTGGNLLLEIRHDGNSLNSTRSVNSIGTSNTLYSGGSLSACWASGYTATSTTTQGNVAVIKFDYVTTTTPVTSVTVTTQGSVPATITTNAGTLQMQAIVLPAAANQNVAWSIVPGTGTATISGTGLVTAQTNGTVWARAVSVQDATKRDSMLVTMSNQNIPITSIVVSTVGSVPATITTLAGSLQMQATILPAAANQNVTWSIVPGTGTATISGTGLVTAQTNGTVWAKAVSIQDATKRDSLQITISNQVVPITSIVVSTVGSVPATITTNAGSLQMQATILPATANQNVTWSIVPGTGTATISGTGLVTAQTNGTVWAKAVSVQDATKRDSLQITISNQVVPITSIVVSTVGSVPATITTNAGSLQMQATILPATANQNVTWSIVPGTGNATISGTGLVTAQTNGTVWAKAVSVQDATKSDSLQITISNQVVPITSIVVSTVGSVPATIIANAGNLQMQATILPATANQNVTWSIVPGTGTATISVTGLVTAQTNGTVWAKAVSVQDATKRDSLQITISNQRVSVGHIEHADAFTIFPNPVSEDVVTLKFKPGFVANNSMKYVMVDAQGKQILEGFITKDNTILNMTGISIGTYFLNITGEGIRAQRTLIKAK